MRTSTPILTKFVLFCLLGLAPLWPSLWAQNAVFYSSTPPCDTITAAPTIVGSAVQCSDTGSCTMNMTNTGGNHIYVAVTSGSPGTLSYSDSKGNTYNLVNAPLVSAGANPNGLSVALSAVADNIAAGSNTITCGSTSVTGYPLFCGAFEFHDTFTTNVLDQTSAFADVSGVTTTSSGHTPITTQAKELAVSSFETTTFPASAGPGSPYMVIQSQGPDTLIAQVISIFTTSTCAHQITTVGHNTGFATLQLATFK